ncbi:MAG: bifunctional [glutamine synthetase] adenylyltransferase/[glutamine synthetase]-adenylyl-L-tyrosine phosphorylase [Pseudomonadota bacterium]
MLDLKPIGGSLPALLKQAADNAPYLKRLIDRDFETLAVSSLDDLGGKFEPWLEGWREAFSHVETIDAAMAPLRKFKREAHLLIALQDLSGAATEARITERLSVVADLATQTALNVAAGDRSVSKRGLFFLALGKHGARELNYSSDIDLIALYDQEKFDGGDRDRADASARMVRDVIGLLETQTADGYVFRTDFRLRPDPSSTPVAVSTAMAETYYESVGQNWERMAYIKARPIAGDIEAGADFLDRLAPFVWRRHLDYWTIADIHAIKRMINSQVGAPDLGDVQSDLKLGPGGIREIEFFAQTQQIILGGRDRKLREPTTCGALVRLAEAGVMDWATSRDLTSAYHALRAVEHRVQMLNDEQTHRLPQFETGRDKVAALCGYASRAGFEADLVTLREEVHRHYQDLFSEEERKTETAIRGNLVFTGVDLDPATIATLSALGFSQPEKVITRVQSWHRGRVPATRTGRGRQLLTAVLPDLLNAMGRTGEADTAFERFATFFEGLTAGVQLLSMLLAEARLRDDLVLTLALAPRLAKTLARSPAGLEAMIDGGERDRLRIDPALGFETAIDEARRYHREAALLIGHRLLHGGLTAAEAGEYWTGLADETVTEMAFAAERETERRFGPAPGSWQVFAMGKMGGRELTAGSDLDLIVLFDPADGAIDAQAWFTRFTQRFITALSAPTGEGLLYEIDMRLRPSGRAGPVAVSLAAFARYHEKEAWTWEHMALTRLRPVVGDATLADAGIATARAAILARLGSDRILSDIASMRSRLQRDKPARGPWDFKLIAGGLVDIEFLTQAHLLTAGDAELITGNTADALGRLGSAGVMAEQAVEALTGALAVQQALQQVLRLAVGDASGAAGFSAGLQDRMCRAVGAADFAALEAELARHREAVTALYMQKIGAAATD